MELYDVSEVIEDSLTMQAGTFHRYNIEIDRDNRDVPKIELQ